jgi:hypothetical protein
LVPFPFAVGVARSGTTFLRNILDAHPDLAMVNESYFVTGLWPRRGQYQVDGLFDLPKFAEDLLKDRNFRRNWEVEPAVIRSRFAEPEPIDFADAMRRLYAFYAELREKPRYGDKTPWFVNEISTLAEIFPESKFVHLIRDGRDVALSILELAIGPDHVSVSAEQWSRLISNGRASGRALGPSRYLEIRYEDLASDPEPLIRSICDHFELDFSQEMLDRANVWRRKLPNKVIRRGYVTESGVRDWRREMHPRQVALYEAVAGPRLSELGYERRFECPPLWARVWGRVKVASKKVPQHLGRQGRQLIRLIKVGPSVPSRLKRRVVSRVAR